MTKKTGCQRCGYTKIDLHGGECPMCKPCTDCKEIIKNCVCKESE